MKYLIGVIKDNENGYCYESNSRNARRHLVEQDALVVNVYNIKTYELLSRAERYGDDLILRGSVIHK